MIQLLLRLYLLCFYLFFTVPFSIGQQEKDALFVKKIYSHTLSQSQSYEWLKSLSTGIGNRLSGSPQAAAAVEYMYSLMNNLPYDTVYLQSVTVPKWVRGDKEIVRIVKSNMGTIDIGGLALGNSVSTPLNGLRAEVIEVHGLDTLEQLGRENIEGKIVFFNRPMDPTIIRTGHAYSAAVDQRLYGASEAARYGAAAVLIRSITTLLDDTPHTGTLLYKSDYPQIPAIAISTQDAHLLSDLLEQAPVEVYIKNNCETVGEVTSYNVIGEKKGKTFPDEIILIGGHLDSWDVGQGAHDDGAGCIHAIDAINTLLNLGYKPRRTWRTVLFMNEENGLKGGLTYADISNEKNEFHLLALESDNGGFNPRALAFDAHEERKTTFLKYIYQWQPLLEPYGISLSFSGSGADIGPLKGQKGLLSGLRTDSQRYFDYHHTVNDVVENVNQRELELGTATIASFVYLVDKYGLGL